MTIHDHERPPPLSAAPAIRSFRRTSTPFKRVSTWLGLGLVLLLGLGLGLGLGFRVRVRVRVREVVGDRAREEEGRLHDQGLG